MNWLTANPCSGLTVGKLGECSADLGESIRQGFERSTGLYVLQLPAEHLQEMKGGHQRLKYRRDADADRACRWSGREFGHHVECGEGLACQMILPLEIGLGDRDIYHGHADVAMPE